jgi:bacillithiol biosynthesis cysteine-adding enzyme BshC
VTRSVYDAYLAGGAVAFYGAHFSDSAARAQAVRRAERPLSRDVADVLEEQNAALGPSPARQRNLGALRRGAAAVVTGQQVGLFLGPLYTLCKAASAVAAARALSQECSRPVVPVFWLQTEDHDLPEIAECFLPRASGDPLRVCLPSSADRMSIAHRSLPAEVDACVALLKSELAPFATARVHLERLARHYCGGTPWAEAFAAVLAELFADEGLVLINPRDRRLAAAAAPIHHRALVAAEEIATALLERNQLLEAQGFAPTVHVREGAPLSFVHPQGPAGPRYRLVTTAGRFKEVGGAGVHDLPALRGALERDPLSFSTSVLLRPILQDTLLPTAVFIGGPAEVAYFAQLAPLYQFYGMNMPVVLPRASFRLVEEKTLRVMERLHLRLGDETRPEDELLAAARGRRDEPVELLAQRLLAPFENELEQARPAIEAEGQGLDAAVDKTRASVAAAVAKLAAKVEHARLHRDESIVREVHSIKQALYPNDIPQERFYGLPYFAARYGEGSIVEGMIAALDPFRPQLNDLHLR